MKLSPYFMMSIKKKQTYCYILKKKLNFGNIFFINKKPLVQRSHKNLENVNIEMRRRIIYSEINHYAKHSEIMKYIIIFIFLSTFIKSKIR